MGKIRIKKINNVIKIPKALIIFIIYFIVFSSYSVQVETDSARVNAGEEVLIDYHDVCWIVVNPLGYPDIFVPLRTSLEWSSFIENHPEHITLEECCVEPSSPGTPTITIYSETELDISWTAPVDDGGCEITGYRIQRRTGGGSWSTIVADTGNTATTYSDSGLSQNTNYYYRIAAINSEGVGSYSNENSQYTGHCYVTTGSCGSGYSTLIGGSQSGCATVGPVDSPYPGSVRRYRIISNGQSLTESGCVSTGTQTRTRQGNWYNGNSWSFTGSQVNCRRCQRGDCCAQWWGTADTWHPDVLCTHCTPRDGRYHCSPLCTCHHVHECGCKNAWLRSCSNQAGTLRWCCR